MLAAVIALAICCIGQTFLLAWIYRENTAERSRLLDRIQVPEASRVAAYDAASSSPGRDFPTPDETVPPLDLRWDDDLQLIGSMEDSA